MAVVDEPTVTRPPATSLAAGRQALADLLSSDRVGTGDDIAADKIGGLNAAREGLVVVRCPACGKQQRLSLSEASGDL